MREPKQVLIIPYVIDSNELFLYILKRGDMDYWQWVAGGVEENETTLGAAVRESSEELGLTLTESSFTQLESTCSIPRCYFKSDSEWSDDFYTITEYSFAVKLSENQEISLSREHTEYNKIKYSDLDKYQTWDSNRTAAWELNKRMLMRRL